jgi:serine/threonine protein kinase
MGLKGAKPGRFTPKCAACHHRFLLVISGDPNVAPVVEATYDTHHGSMPGATLAPQEAASHAASANATQPPPSTAPSSPAAGATLAAPVTLPLGGGGGGDASRPPVGLEAPPGDLPPGPESRARSSRHSAANNVGGPTLTGTLGGYELKQKLGQGGMGAVYLARQVSLDRDVALKVLAPQLAADPEFVARFAREAYAAAQLAHHNVVQIHDIGFDRDSNFFSMEFVPGQTLDKLVRDAGRLDPEAAVGYVLQAARGLRFAHDHGLIHRDVKPDNLLLNEQGILKVADLGLVKQAGKAETAGAPSPPRDAGARPGSRVDTASKASPTQFNVSMGTPAYMAPEQARDAAHVDQRADVYSLGCTLYDLLVGRPPFVGQTTVEVLTKHQHDPVVPPDRLVRHVPPELSSIVLRMTAKRPEERYQSMGEVVEALEAFLGVESGRAFSPREEHVQTLEAAVEEFNGAPAAKLRSTLVLGFLGACLAGALLCALPFVGRPLLAGGLVGLALLSVVFYQALIGVTRGTHVFTQVRRLVFGSRVVDWLKFVAATAVFVLLLVAFDLHWVWLGFAVIAAVVAAGFHFSIDRALQRQRAGPLARVEAMLKTMRLRGLDETALRQFVCKYSGPRWEEMYEALFGYEAKRAARRAWGQGERGRNRPRHGAWRDVLADWIDRRLAARRAERERRTLAALEANAMAARGVDDVTAARRARRAAEQMVDAAAHVKAEADRRVMMTAPPARTSSGHGNALAGAAKPLASFADGRAAGDESHPGRRGRDGERAHESYFKRRYGTPLDFILGPQPRILLGVVLLVGFAVWVKINGGPVVSNTGAVTQDLDISEIAQGKQVRERVAAVRQIDVKLNVGKPLRVPLVPDAVCDVIGSYNGGIAGALLLLSGFFAGKLLGLTVLAGAAFALLGHRYPVPLVEGRTWIAAIAGGALGLLGIVMFRRVRD